MVVFESTVNVFSPWNQMADALSMAASIFAVMAFGCSSVPAVLSFPQAVRNVAAKVAVAKNRIAICENEIAVNLACAATAMDKCVFKNFIIVSSILCLSTEIVASSDGKLGRFFCIRWQVR